MMAKFYNFMIALFGGYLADIRREKVRQSTFVIPPYRGGLAVWRNHPRLA